MILSSALLLISLFLPWILFCGMVTAVAVPACAQLVAKPLGWFVLTPQVRTHYDEAELRRLGESMRSLGQLQPVGAKPDGTVLWGHRRVMAARLVGLADLQVIITDRVMSPSEVRVIQLTENMHRADLSGYEKWLACTELMLSNPGWLLTDLSNALKLDPSSVTRYLSPSKCIPAWQEALKAGEAGISECYAASKLPDEAAQASLLAMKRSGASRDQLEQVGRKARSSPTPSVKLARVRCPLPGGATVVISGPQMSLEDVIQALGLAVQAAKAAHKDSLDVKTAQQVWKDKAKA